MVTGETKSFFSFAKSVSQTCGMSFPLERKKKSLMLFSEHFGKKMSQMKLSSFGGVQLASLCVILLQWWQVEKVNPIKLYEENKVIAGFSLLNILFKHKKSGLLRSVMEKLLHLYEQNKITPVVDSLWALEEVGGLKK